MIHGLANCEWLQNRQNILIFGPTGVGKSYLSCAIGHAACRMGYPTRYYRISKLLEKLLMARGDGTYFKVFNTIKRIDLLILDDWGLKTLSSTECNELLEIFEERFNKSSTIISSQLPLEHWTHALTEPTLADAILDRIVHNAHKIFMKGESMRKVKSNISKIDENDQVS
jgi:DNA replication protein DnaC